MSLLRNWLREVETIYYQAKLWEEKLWKLIDGRLSFWKTVLIERDGNNSEQHTAWSQLGLMIPHTFRDFKLHTLVNNQTH